MVTATLRQYQHLQCYCHLKLKMGIDCVSDEQLAKLTEVSHFVSEAANMAAGSSVPYSAAVLSVTKPAICLRRHQMAGFLSAHDPAKVGNRLKVVVSELSGKGNIIYKAKERGLNVPLQGKEAKKLLEQIKQLESRGFQFDNAEASFDMLVQRAMPDYKPLFERLISWSSSKNGGGRPPQRHRRDALRAMVKLS